MEFCVCRGGKSGFVTSEGCCTSANLSALARSQMSTTCLGWDLKELDTVQKSSSQPQTTPEEKRTVQIIQ